ncbi:hypothetical protein Bpfe_030482 [Biomphalaria pfeifferi]|uniref:Uncharacterized protein n=1 Tax=Biomphalaria pfeifferi TaxID=112525 RepID=A0AAD8EVA7_BIOPF|nr:hypothetical protein Bpfe_030482 [Biomphalaria pfeifferi]
MHEACAAVVLFTSTLWTCSAVIPCLSPVLMSVMDGKVSWQNVTFLTSWPILLQAMDLIVYPVSGERDLTA